ncbi:hypothetical protein CAL29_28070 [Bordetella genomosp. 10]|uniref:Phage tail assembly protein n=1 Tax=Bordetella genomosp. 10 TaxID=1416804 RepID=A0A261S464_9BORD|nr:phage tail assembly chaperone [Bordetella genomosp. 10]OZI31732.1 hypothetical protein CAL29_28070 [Bordetella genomosp. 10]
MAAKIKFTLNPQPTFKHKVKLPIPGADFAEVEFTFRHRSKSEFKEFMEQAKDQEDDAALVMDMACGWELQESFDRENVEKLVENFVGAARAIFTAYVDELIKARVGN